MFLKVSAMVRARMRFSASLFQPAKTSKAAFQRLMFDYIVRLTYTFQVDR